MGMIDGSIGGEKIRTGTEFVPYAKTATDMTWTESKDYKQLYEEALVKIRLLNLESDLNIGFLAKMTEVAKGK